MAEEQQTDSLADLIAGATGVLVAFVTFLILSTLFSAGWAIVFGFLMGAVFSWTTWWTIRHWFSGRQKKGGN